MLISIIFILVSNIMILPTILQLIIILVSSSCHTIFSGCSSCSMHQYITQSQSQSDHHKLEQRNKRFWRLNEQSGSWVEVQLPYDLVSCTGGDCTIVTSIIQQGEEERSCSGYGYGYGVVPVRKRMSLTKMSETSVWVTGESGSIYERFWNGVQWVIAPHHLHLPLSAVSVFMVNQTILALSGAASLFQLQVTQDSQPNPIWVQLDNSQAGISSGVVSNDGQRIYFCTRSGVLLELLGVDPPRWENHGRPPGANVSAISDGAKIRAGLLLIVSGAGDLYEYDQTSKPPWKKHIHGQGSTRGASLLPFKACTLHGLVGPHSVSVFLLTKEGELIERRLHQRKWKWMAHGNPKGHVLTSITCTSQGDSNAISLLLTTAAGFVFEYQIHKNHQGTQEYEDEEKWINHKHPPNARVARGISGLQLQVGRTMFQLDDGRLAELHLSGLGGEALGPNIPITSRRKALLKYVWSVLDAPESEGWNAEYCSEERGPSNCLLGTKDETTTELSISRRRKDAKTQHTYLIPDDAIATSVKDHAIRPDKSKRKLFRLRLMQGGKSFFLITNNYMTFEYLNTENSWFWLRHEHATRIHSALGSYNGSLFVVDEHGSLLIRERSSSNLAWTNCTAMRKGRQVISGPPWDGISGQPVRAKLEDAIFFVSTTGKLLQFTVALRKYKWKDCKNPPGTKVASIVDQEGFRENVVFVVGKNGRLYQYNIVTQLWHEHYQSQHLVLSTSPGTAMRPLTGSLKGSLFMLSEDGGLVEYRWSGTDGWNWIEHGTPHTSVALVGAPGPCFGGTQFFLIGSDGSVYLRYLDQEEWKWRHCGFPLLTNENVGEDGEFADAMDKLCDPKVSSTRPVPFSEDSVIFELQDGRLGEMRRMEDKNWMWSRTIATPTSLCMANFWISA